MSVDERCDVLILLRKNPAPARFRKMSVDERCDPRPILLAAIPGARAAGNRGFRRARGVARVRARARVRVRVRVRWRWRGWGCGYSLGDELAPLTNY